MSAFVDHASVQTRGVDASQSRDVPEMAQEPRSQRVLIQVIVCVALVVTLLYLVWRTWATVNLAAWWVSIPLLSLEIHAAVGLALHAFSLWNVDSLRPADPVAKSSQRVAVLITTYNEPEEVLLPTIASAIALEPAHETWVLDDGSREWVAELAHALGARYLARADNRDAKAGNLNNALAHVDADVIALLDADHAAAPNFLRHTLGYFDDPDVALVQTPQAFYNDGSFEDVPPEQRWLAGATDKAYHEQELFYRVIQPGKNRWSAAFWCGTGAVIRVAALCDIDGVATGTVTEDIQTTIRWHRHGWKTVYHNEVLAEGLAAATAEQYVLQRHRWCTGAMQVLKKEHPLLGRGLTLSQRLSYAATLLGWFDAWRTLGYLLLPMVVLVDGSSPIDVNLGTFALAFGVTFALQQLALYVLSRGRGQLFFATIFELVRMTPTLYATLSLVRPTATKFRVTPKGRSESGRSHALIPWLLVTLLVLSLVAAVWYLMTLLGLTWVTYEPAAVAHGAMLWLLFNGVLIGAAIKRTLAERYAGERRASHRFSFNSPAMLAGADCTVMDVSLTGARVEVYADDAPAGVQTDPIPLELEDGAPSRLCEIRTRNMLDDERVELGLEFVDDSPSERAKLALWAFHHRRRDVQGEPNDDRLLLHPRRAA